MPKECADVVLVNDKIQAAPADVTPAQCEAKPDRCYWDTGLDRGGPKCYYKKGDMHNKFVIKFRTLALNMHVTCCGQNKAAIVIIIQYNIIYIVIQFLKALFNSPKREPQPR